MNFGRITLNSERIAPGNCGVYLKEVDGLCHYQITNEPICVRDPEEYTLLGYIPLAHPDSPYRFVFNCSKARRVDLENQILERLRPFGFEDHDDDWLDSLSPEDCAAINHQLERMWAFDEYPTLDQLKDKD